MTAGRPDPQASRSLLRRLTWADWACAALLVVLAVIEAHNVRAYSWIAGYDAREHVDYAIGLIEDWRLPSTGISYTPPVFYFLAGAAYELGEVLGMAEPEKAGQYLSAALTLATAVLVLVLARLLFPGRRVLHVAALAFFAASPSVLKTAAMFHPQPLALALSTLALVIAAHMIVRDRYPWWELSGLALVLGIAQLVRNVALWTVGVVVIVLTVALIRQLRGRRLALTLAGVLVAVVAIPLPWYLYLGQNYSNPILGRGELLTLGNRPLSFYVDPGLPELFTHPQREELPRKFFPILYADTWGDHFGFWTWAPPRELTPAVNRRLAVQSAAGALPTFVGVAGWLGLLAFAVARWRARTELLLVALLPAAALAGMAYYDGVGYAADVDTVKGVFALTAIPAWAICFAFALDAVWYRSRALGGLLAVLLAVSGLVCLEFGWL